jgi:diacylglycerol kinase family enzyme
MPKNRVHLLANQGSGQGAGQSISKLAGSICLELGYDLVVHTICEPNDLNLRAKEAIAEAEKSQEVVMIAGGDGSVRSVAELAAGKNVRFAVVPCGTFNFFARTHQIPEDLNLAIRNALTGTVKEVRLGSVNDHVFLVNASLGLYAKSIINRELDTARFGRNRIVVILSTLTSFLSHHKTLDVTFCLENKEKKLHTSMIFIGNNAMQLRNLSIPVVRCFGQDLLALVILKPLKKIDVLRLMFRGLFKFWDHEDRLQSFCVESATIQSKRAVHLVALDGEVFHLKSPLVIKAMHHALNLVVPGSAQ